MKSAYLLDKLNTFKQGPGFPAFLDDPFADGFGDGFRFGMDLEFFINPFDIKFNRVDAVFNFLGRGIVIMTFDQ